MSEPRETYTTADPVSEETMGRAVLGWMGYHIYKYYNHDFFLMLGDKQLRMALSEKQAWNAAPNLLTESGAAQLLTFLRGQKIRVTLSVNINGPVDEIEFCTLESVREYRNSEGSGTDWPYALLRAAYALCPKEQQKKEVGGNETVN